MLLSLKLKILNICIQELIKKSLVLGGWMGRWVGGKAVLKIAYSNQLLRDIDRNVKQLGGGGGRVVKFCEF